MEHVLLVFGDYHEQRTLNVDTAHFKQDFRPNDDATYVGRFSRYDNTGGSERNTRNIASALLFPGAWAYLRLAQAYLWGQRLPNAYITFPRLCIFIMI